MPPVFNLFKMIKQRRAYIASLRRSFLFLSHLQHKKYCHDEWGNFAPTMLVCESSSRDFCCKMLLVAVALRFVACIIFIRIILRMGSANEKRRYIVPPSLIGWAHAQKWYLRSIVSCGALAIQQYGNLPVWAEALFLIICLRTVPCVRLRVIIPCIFYQL